MAHQAQQSHKVPITWSMVINIIFWSGIISKCILRHHTVWNKWFGIIWTYIWMIILYIFQVLKHSRASKIHQQGRHKYTALILISYMLVTWQYKLYWNITGLMREGLMKPHRYIMASIYFPHYWPLLIESTCDQWIFFTKGQSCRTLVFSYFHPQHAVAQTMKLPMVWDTMTLKWHLCYDTHLCVSCRHLLKPIWKHKIIQKKSEGF